MVPRVFVPKRPSALLCAMLLARVSGIGVCDAAAQTMGLLPTANAGARGNVSAALAPRQSGLGRDGTLGLDPHDALLNQAGPSAPDLTQGGMNPLALPPSLIRQTVSPAIEPDGAFSGPTVDRAAPEASVQPALNPPSGVPGIVAPVDVEPAALKKKTGQGQDDPGPDDFIFRGKPIPPVTKLIVDTLPSLRPSLSDQGLAAPVPADLEDQGRLLVVEAYQGRPVTVPSLDARRGASESAAHLASPGVVLRQIASEISRLRGGNPSPPDVLHLLERQGGKKLMVVIENLGPVPNSVQRRKRSQWQLAYPQALARADLNHAEPSRVSQVPPKPRIRKNGARRKPLTGALPGVQSLTLRTLALFNP